jgi:hypothetical protein
VSGLNLVLKKDEFVIRDGADLRELPLLPNESSIFIMEKGRHKYDRSSGSINEDSTFFITEGHCCPVRGAGISRKPRPYK